MEQSDPKWRTGVGMSWTVVIVSIAAVVASISAGWLVYIDPSIGDRNKVILISLSALAAILGSIAAWKTNADQDAQSHLVVGTVTTTGQGLSDQLRKTQADLHDADSKLVQANERAASIAIELANLSRTFQAIDAIAGDKRFYVVLSTGSCATESQDYRNLQSEFPAAKESKNLQLRRLTPDSFQLVLGANQSLTRARAYYAFDVPFAASQSPSLRPEPSTAHPYVLVDERCKPIVSTAVGQESASSATR